MDDDKKKRLEELRKELDPSILSKMANYLGGEEASALSALDMKGAPPKGGAVDSGSYVSKSAADKIRDRRARRFQEKIAQKKRAARMNIESSGAVQNEFSFDRPVYIFCTTDIWTKIIDSQFKVLGYKDAVPFSSFSGLMETILASHSKKPDRIFDIAVAFQDVKAFILGWHKIQKRQLSDEAQSFLESINLFFVVESMKQASEKFISVYGSDSVISITDDVAENRVKVITMVNRKNPELQQGPKRGNNEEDTDS